MKSVRFDPFNILSLPLPLDRLVYIEVKRMLKEKFEFILIIIYLVIRLDGSKPTRYGMKLDSELSVDHIKKQLSILSSLSMEQIAFFDVTVPSCFRRYTVMDTKNAKIKQLNIRDFIAYELPLMKLIDMNNFSLTYVIGIHRRLERQERYLSPLTREKIIFFGYPILFHIIIVVH